MRKIYKYAAVIIRSGLVLLVKKRGTNVFISPGGKPEKGELKKDCLARELMEELSVNLLYSHKVGVFSKKSAFENKIITVEVDISDVSGNPVASSEIEEIAWVDKNSTLDIGSVFADEVIPLLSKNGSIRKDTPRYNPNNKNIFVFDIDGTLAFDGEINNSIIVALNKIKNSKHHSLIFATSRAPRGVIKVLGEELIQDSKVICCNGTIIYHENKTLECLSYIFPGFVLEIVEYFETNGIQFYLEYGNEFLHSEIFSFYSDMNDYNKSSVFNRNQKGWSEGVIKISCRSDDIKNDISGLQGKDFNSLSFNFHGSETAEITCAENNKYTALNKILNSESPPFNIIAFGNDSNDFEMIAKAEQGYIVGNELKGLEYAGNVERLSKDKDKLIEMINLHMNHRS